MASKISKEESIKQDVQQQIIAAIGPEVAKGTYANAVRANVADSEVVLDFAFVIQPPEEPRSATVVSRIIINHDLAKKIADMLPGVLEQYKKKKEKNGAGHN